MYSGTMLYWNWRKKGTILYLKAVQHGDLVCHVHCVSVHAYCNKILTDWNALIKENKATSFWKKEVAFFRVNAWWNICSSYASISIIRTTATHNSCLLPHFHRQVIGIPTDCLIWEVQMIVHTEGMLPTDHQRTQLHHQNVRNTIFMVALYRKVTIPWHPLIIYYEKTRLKVPELSDVSYSSVSRAEYIYGKEATITKHVQARDYVVWHWMKYKMTTCNCIHVHVHVRMQFHQSVCFNGKPSFISNSN